MSGRSSDYNVVDGRYVAITPELERMAQVIRDTFVAARRAYVPNAGGVGSAQYKHFMKAALMCRQLKEDPREFTMRQVKQMAEYGNFFPSALHSDKLSMKGQESAGQDRYDDIARYRAQLLLFNDMCGHFTAEQVLKDPVNQFTPLFRTCMAMRAGLWYIIERYRGEAQAELAAHPIAREVFKDEAGQL